MVLLNLRGNGALCAYRNNYVQKIQMVLKINPLFTELGLFNCVVKKY